MSETKPMTEAEINALAGADLVRAVCVHVFGLREIVEEDDDAEDGRPAFQLFADRACHVFNAPTPPDAFCPLNDWNDTFRVAAEIERRGYYLETRGREYDGGPYRAGFTKLNYASGSGAVAFGDTGQEALLRAALAVVLTEKEVTR